MASAQKVSLKGAEIPSFHQELSTHFSEYQVFQIPTQSLSAENQVEENFQLQITLGNQHLWNINLTSSQIISPNYREILGTKNGPVILPPRKNIAYIGYVAGSDQKSRLTLDKGWIMGFITTPDGQKIYIEPLATLQPNAGSNQYLVYSGNAVLNNSAGSCGALQVINRTPDSEDSIINDPIEDPVTLTNEDCVEVDFSIGSAFDMINGFHNSPELVMNHIISITNMMQAYYDFVPMQYLLNDNYVSASPAADPFTNSQATSTDVLLPKFQNWAQNEGVFSEHDVAQIWTARNITGCGIGRELIGCAYISTICDPFRYNICEDFAPNNIRSLSILSAHELGHNWNCRHEDIGTPPFDIMNAPVNVDAIGFGPNSRSKILDKINNSDCLSVCGGTPPEENCTAQSEFPFQEWIEDVTIGPLANLGSGKFRDYATAGYSDFTDLSSDPVNRGNQVDYTFNAGFSGSNPGDYWTAFIDYNQNNIFDLPEEEVIRARGTSIAGTITIPSNAMSGVLLLRVILSKEGFSGPCDNPAFGEVEDYLLTIEGGITPPPPGLLADLTINNLSLANQANTNTIVDFNIDIANIGDEGTGSFSLGVFLSTDNQLSSNDPLIGEIPTGNFTPGTSVENVNGAFNLAGVTQGSYFVFFKIDKDDVVPESNESNNIISRNFSVTGNINPGDFIDLELDMSATIPNPARFSKTRITLTLTNKSTTFATNISTQLFLSPDNDFAFSGDGSVSFTGGGTFSTSSGTWRLPSLPGGATATVSFDLFTLSDDFDPCAQIVSVDQDDGDSTPGNGQCPITMEDDEANLNSSKPPPPSEGVDISVSLSVSDSSPEVFTKIFYQVTVVNEGTETATGLKIDFDYGAQEQPNRLALVNNPNPEYSTWQGIWDIGTLGAGEARTFELEVFVLPDARPQTTRTALVANLNQSDLNPGNDHSSSTISLEEGATLSEDGRSTTTTAKRPLLSIDNLFPNPAVAEVTVAIHSREDLGLVPLQIFDAFGKMVRSDKVALNRGTNIVNIPVEDFSEGVYLIVLPTASRKNLVKRFVKMK